MEKEKKKRKARDPSWRLWETLCGIHAVISIRDKFAQVLVNAEMMREFNRLFGDLVDECENGPLCPTARGRRPFLSLHHQNKGLCFVGICKNKTKVRGKCVMGMHFYCRKF